MAVEDVIALFGELRAAEGRLAKARVLGRGLVVLRDLSPQERRRVALAIAEQTAPQLAPELRERTGLELDAATLTELIDLARDLDDEDLEEVIGRLRDPHQRWDAVEDLVEDVVDPPDDHLPAPPAPPVAPPVAPPDPVPVPPAPSGVDAEEPAPATPPAVVEPDVLSFEPEPATTVPETVESSELPGTPSFLPAPAIDPSTAGSPGAKLEPPPTSVAAEDELAQDRDIAVVREVRRAGSSRAKLRLVERAGESIYDLGPAGRLELVRALPDGWVRRRAVHRMLEFDVIAASDCVPIIRTFTRSSDRNWVAGSMLAAGLVRPGELEDVVDPSALERLAARTSRA